MYRRDLCGRVPGSDVQGCHTLIAGRSSGYRYVRLRSSREADEEPNPMVYPYGDSTGARQLSSLQHSSARRTRDVRSSTTLCRCVCIEEARQFPGGRSSWMMCARIYMRCQRSSDKNGIHPDGRAARTYGHREVFAHKVCRNLVSGPRTSFVGCLTCRAEQSCHKDSG